MKSGIIDVVVVAHLLLRKVNNQQPLCTVIFSTPHTSMHQTASISKLQLKLEISLSSLVAWSVSINPPNPFPSFCLLLVKRESEWKNNGVYWTHNDITKRKIRCWVMSSIEGNHLAESPKRWAVCHKMNRLQRPPPARWKLRGTPFATETNRHHKREKCDSCMWRQ